MAPICCERCEAPGAVRAGGRVALCAACIRRALACRFPIFGIPLELLEAALAELEPRQRRPLRVQGGR